MYFAVYVCLLFLPLSVYSSSWTQQYGDPASTNYVPQPKHPQTTGWNYTIPNDYDYYPVSYIYNSPAISKDGVIFLPFAFTRPYPILLLLQVRAVSPQGKELWITPGKLDYGNEACASILLTNALYSEEHNMIIIGWNCAHAFPYYEKSGQLVAINATNGFIIWKTDKLLINDVATISMNSDTVFLSGGFSCYEDGMIIVQKQTNKSLIMGIDLLTGKMSWSAVKNHAGCRTAQTKVTPLRDGSTMVMFPVNLPGGPYAFGDILSLKCSSYQCTQAWLEHIHITYDARFAFSEGGVMFGNYGLAGSGPDQIFGLDVQSGKLLFNRTGACDSGVFPSGPAVDREGNAYFSCGNKVFAVNSKGELLWESKTVNDSGYPFDSLYKHSPAIHLDRNLIVFVDANCAHIYVLSSKDGSISGTTSVAKLRGSGCTEPPLLVGDVVYVIKEEGDYSTSFLYSISLTDMLL